MLVLKLFAYYDPHILQTENVCYQSQPFMMFKSLKKNIHLKGTAALLVRLWKLAVLVVQL